MAVVMNNLISLKQDFFTATLKTCFANFASDFFLLNRLTEKVLVLILGVKVDSNPRFTDLLDGDNSWSADAWSQRRD